MNRKLPFYLLVCFIGFSFTANSLDHDLSFWTSVALKHKFTTRSSVEIAFQERQNRNLLTNDSWLGEAGFEYKFSKDFSASINYRFIAKNELKYFSSRHRGYVDLKYKFKFSKVTVNLRERIQSQIKDVYSSETGKIPEYVSRTKAVFKFDVGERYTPYVATEMYFQIRVPNSEGYNINRFRYECGFDYEFNLIHQLNAFFMYQQNLEETLNDVVFGVGYTYNLQ
ncbi:MAG: DUF2490 domain-containing protein [Bacteroidetes bacterium]|nr:DUF2490 domain-containing protein [Bacteroidota bacterium]